MFQIIYTNNRKELKSQFIEARNLAECLKVWAILKERVGAVSCTIIMDRHTIIKDSTPLPALPSTLKLVA